MVALLGERDEYLKLVEAAFACDILVRGNQITISGEHEEAEKVAQLFQEELALIEQGQQLTTAAVGQTIELIKGERLKPTDVLGDVILTRRGKAIAPRTAGQKAYVDAIRRSTVTFAIGPAGTGKSYLAVALAIKALQDKEVARIILTRPAVEAGERLGFLPGTLYEKIDPYMRPLYDALYEMTDAEALPRLMERGTVEVAPLAFMRGRTLNDSFIILDEAQNTSPEQMKMFLTRLGFGSKVVINGDVTQTDLQPGQRSGLLEVAAILSDIPGIEFVNMDAKDVVRHRIVQDIVEAYRIHTESRSEQSG
jgi:phosphate starvation-inducible PhoH-like protein